MRGHEGAIAAHFAAGTLWLLFATMVGLAFFLSFHEDMIRLGLSDEAEEALRFVVFGRQLAPAYSIRAVFGVTLVLAALAGHRSLKMAHGLDHAPSADLRRRADRWLIVSAIGLVVAVVAFGSVLLL